MLLFTTMGYTDKQTTRGTLSNAVLFKKGHVESVMGDVLYFMSFINGIM